MEFFQARKLDGSILTVPLFLLANVIEYDKLYTTVIWFDGGKVVRELCLTVWYD